MISDDLPRRAKQMPSFLIWLYRNPIQLHIIIMSSINKDIYTRIIHVRRHTDVSAIKYLVSCTKFT